MGSRWNPPANAPSWWATYMATVACETFGVDADEPDKINSEAKVYGIW